MLSNNSHVPERSFVVDPVLSRPRWLKSQHDATTDAVCSVLVDENHDFDNFDWRDFSARSQIALGVNLQSIPPRRLADGNADVVDTVTNVLNSKIQ